MNKTEKPVESVRPTAVSVGTTDGRRRVRRETGGRAPAETSRLGSGALLQVNITSLSFINLVTLWTSILSL